MKTNETKKLFAAEEKESTLKLLSDVRARILAKIKEDPRQWARKLEAKANAGALQTVTVKAMWRAAVNES